MEVMGYPFIFNGIPSEQYNASLVFLDEDAQKRPSGSNTNFDIVQIRRNPKQFCVDATQSESLKFGIEVAFNDPVDIYTLTQVKDWLGGPLQFSQLQICAENFNSFYFNCYIELKEDLIYNGGYYGVTGEVHCDAPFAWEFERTKTYNLTAGSTNNLYFNNVSADSELLRPLITITMGSAGDFSLTDVQNNNSITSFTGLSAGEVLTLDNLYGIITSSTGLRRVSNFNKIFLKMPKGQNKLIVTGNAVKLQITYTNAKRLGGGYY